MPSKICPIPNISGRLRTILQPNMRKKGKTLEKQQQNQETELPTVRIKFSSGL